MSSPSSSGDFVDNGPTGGGEPVVHLRNATLADVPLLDHWRRDPVEAGTYNDFGESSQDSYRRSIQDGTLIDARGGLLVVVVEGQPVGTVTWRQVSYGPNPESGGWNIGISLTPAVRGRGIGALAQDQLARRLFETTQVNRVEASTDMGNIAEQRSFEKAGFSSRRDFARRPAPRRRGA